MFGALVAGLSFGIRFQAGWELARYAGESMVARVTGSTTQEVSWASYEERYGRARMLAERAKQEAFDDEVRTATQAVLGPVGPRRASRPYPAYR